MLHTTSLMGLHVILCLVDNWHYYNGVAQVRGLLRRGARVAEGRG